MFRRLAATSPASRSVKNARHDHHAVFRPAKPAQRWLRGGFVVSCAGAMLMAAAQAETVTDVYGSFGGFWHSSTAQISVVRPNDSNELLGFTVASGTYSTGVNDAALTTESVPFTPAVFEAVRPAGLAAPNSSSFFGIARNWGGQVQGATGVVPGSSFPLSDYLYDGAQGLELITAIFNLPVSELRFDVPISDVDAINDGVPDIVTTQMGQAGTSDHYRFIDASGNTVGVQVPVNFAGGVPSVGEQDWSFYSASDPARPYQAGISGATGTRPIRMLAFELSDFGITAANAGNVVAFVQHLSGQSDVAFVAYNRAALGEPVKIEVTKTTAAVQAVPGSTVQYTVTVSNTGSVSANQTRVADPVPAGVAGMTWTCTATGGASCTAAGSGPIDDMLGSFPAGSSVTYAVQATLNAGAPAAVLNEVTVTPPAVAAQCVAAGGATSPPPCRASVQLPPAPQLAITKSANATTVTPGGSIVYTITVTNTGAVAANGVSVTDPVPAGIASMDWTCTGPCPAPNGAGALNETLATLAPGATLSYTVNATVSANPPASVVNTASVNPGNGGVCAPDNTAVPCTATASVPPPPPAGSVTPVPTLGQWGLMLLSAVLAAFGWRANRRRAM